MATVEMPKLNDHHVDKRNYSLENRDNRIVLNDSEYIRFLPPECRSKFENDLIRPELKETSNDCGLLNNVKSPSYATSSNIVDDPEGNKPEQLQPHSAHQCIEESISEKSKQKISFLLHEITQLSDLDKLFLYLKLPTGFPEAPDPLKINHNYPLGNRPHVTQAFNWIKTHLDENSEISLPKHEVYDSYRIYCDLHDVRPLSTADFGKAIKQMFPKVKPRRLGTRGNSRYCYSGLCKRKTVDVPCLPNIEEISNVNESTGSSKSQASQFMFSFDEDLLSASSNLIFEWAGKLLNQKFDSLNKLASHLLNNMLVSKSSVAAFTFLTLVPQEKLDSPSNDVNVTANDYGEGLHKEAQMQLHRKIYEKDLVKEQRRKVDQTAVLRGPFDKIKSKKNTGHKAKDVLRTRNELKNVRTEEKKRSSNVPKKCFQRSSSAGDILNSKLSDADIKNSSDNLLNRTEVAINLEDASGANGSKDASPIHNQTNKKMASIIFVPSISTVQLTNLSKTKPKYKPIQPKPSHDEAKPYEDVDDINANVERRKIELNFTPSSLHENDSLNVVAETSHNGIFDHNRLKRSVQPEFHDFDHSKKAHMEKMCPNGENNVLASSDLIQSESIAVNLSSIPVTADDKDAKYVMDDQNLPTVTECIETSSAPVNKTEQLSQLRLLLQQNLNKESTKSHGTPKSFSRSSVVGGSFVSNGDQMDNSDGMSHVHGDIDANLSNDNFCIDNNQCTTNNTSFQFTPISKHTTPESLCSTNQSSLANSPVPNSYHIHQSQNIFGPQSTESPFVSPRATPLSRSRHNSGQTCLRSLPTHSTSDNSNNSPFLSPHGTPVHVRSRHGSGVQPSARFASMGMNSKISSALPSVRELNGSHQNDNMYVRTRNISGPNLLPSSPLSKSAPMSPMYSQFSNSQPDLSQDSCYRLVSSSSSTHLQGQRQLLCNNQNVTDTSLEIRNLLQNPTSDNGVSNSSRCQSVPLYQMLYQQPALANNANQDVYSFSKSYPATPNEHQAFNFPMKSENLEKFASENSANVEMLYPSAQSSMSLQPSYPGTPTASYPGTPIDTISDSFNQSNTLLYESSDANLAQFQETVQTDYDDLQVALDNLKNCSDLSQLEKDLENNL